MVWLKGQRRYPTIQLECPPLNSEIEKRMENVIEADPGPSYAVGLIRMPFHRFRSGLATVINRLHQGSALCPGYTHRLVEAIKNCNKSFAGYERVANIALDILEDAFLSKTPEIEGRSLVDMVLGHIVPQSYFLFGRHHGTNLKAIVVLQMERAHDEVQALESKLGWKFPDWSLRKHANQKEMYLGCPSPPMELLSTSLL